MVLRLKNRLESMRLKSLEVVHDSMAFDDLTGIRMIGRSIGKRYDSG